LLLKRGEVWEADFDQHQDSRQNGLRPAVVVQTDLLNDKEGYPLTILVPLSGSGSVKIPSHALVLPSGQNGLDKESFAKCEQIQALPKSHLIRRRGNLSPEDLAKVTSRLKNALGLYEE
jgi:mRNA interferase MazF